MANSILLNKNSFGSVGVTNNQMHINFHIIELLNTTKQKFEAAIDNLNVFILNWNFFMTTLLDEETAKKYQIEFILSESEKKQTSSNEVDLSKIQFGDVDSLLNNMTQRISSIKARYDYCVNKSESYNVWTPQKFKVRVKNTNVTTSGKVDGGSPNGKPPNLSEQKIYNDEGIQVGALSIHYTKWDFLVYQHYVQTSVQAGFGCNNTFSHSNLLSCITNKYETKSVYGYIDVEVEAKSGARSLSGVFGSFYAYIRFLAK